LNKNTSVNKLKNTYSTCQMGSIPRAIPAHRLSHQQILGHTRTLCLALADAKIQCIRGLVRDKKFIKDQIFTLKHLVVILAMSLISEVACLRLITVLLLIVLLSLSFYILYDALTRCREVESKLTHELSEMSLLTTDDSDTENEDWKIILHTKLLLVWPKITFEKNKR